MEKRPVVGIVVPVEMDRTPAEASLMYPGVDFISRGVGVKSLTPAGFDGAWDRIAPAVAELDDLAVDAIMVAGTSLTFYRGYKAHQDLLEFLRSTSSVPLSTMSEAIVKGLRAVAAKRVALATAYADELNKKLVELLTRNDFDVVSLESFGLTTFGDPTKKSESDIQSLAGRAIRSARSPDALLISCGGLPTLNCAVPLEREFGISVVTSTQACFWMACGLAGVNASISGYGRMLEHPTLLVQ